jgi:glutathione S-transferase
MTIRVHHLRNSRSTRIIWLMEELGLDYELIEHTRGADFRSPPSLYEAHPLGKAPAVEIDGRVMVESSAIIEYVVDTRGGGKLLPPDGGRAEYLEWLHFAEGTLGMPVLMRLLGPVRLQLGEAGIGFMDAEIAKQLDWIESQLEGKSFLCGETFTGADINLEYLLEHVETLGQIARRPNLARYYAALKARPGYLKAIELGGPITFTR